MCTFRLWSFAGFLEMVLPLEKKQSTVALEVRLSLIFKSRGDHFLKFPWWLSAENLPTTPGDEGLIPELEDGGRKWQPTSILAWEIIWTEEPAGLPSMDQRRVQ